MKVSLLIATFLASSVPIFAETQAIDLSNATTKAIHVAMKPGEISGKPVLVVTKDPSVTAFDEPTFVKLPEKEFRNGTIEVKVMSKLLQDAPDFARGFIGVAFRINEDNSKFECIYVRPTNGRAEDQLRRNRTVQYFSYPDFKFERLRKETPGKYEAYADMTLDEWITLKIEVKGEKAKLFLNGGEQPALIVNDLKHGADEGGAIGLWVDIGTEGFFKDLKVTPE